MAHHTIQGSRVSYLGGDALGEYNRDGLPKLWHPRGTVQNASLPERRRIVSREADEDVVEEIEDSSIENDAWSNSLQIEDLVPDAKPREGVKATDNI